MQLLKGVDTEKDQSYFLASIRPSALTCVLFPLGDYTKANVRQIAQDANLATATKRSSAGICFIGRRNFADFLSEYVPAVPGKFIDVDTGRYVGTCRNITAVTLGQRPRIGGASDRMYIVGKDVV